MGGPQHINVILGRITKGYEKQNKAIHACNIRNASEHDLTKRNDKGRSGKVLP